MRRHARLVVAVAAIVAVGVVCAGAAGAKAKPKFTSFPKATHGVVPQITRGPDGRMWYPEPYADQIGAVTSAGVASHYRAGVAKGDAPNTIAAGPDGKLWYTLYSSAGKIGRMTTKGARVEFDTGAVANSLVGVGPGSGASMWVGGEFSQLWHFDTNGGVLAHIVPPALTASRIPVKFVLGKDGRTWVDLGIFIAAIDSAGTVTEYTQGYTPSPNIRDMVAGPDGNIWFVDSENLNVTGAIGRITPAGAVTLFSQGLRKGSAPLGITVGPDHNLWFTENAGGPHIGRITTSGVITTYKVPLPGSYTTTGIARGQGKTLWVTSNGVAGLVRVTLP